MFKRGYWALTKIQKPYFLVGSEQVTFFFFSVACKFFGWFKPGTLIGRLIKTMCIVYLVDQQLQSTEPINFTPWANAQS